MCSVNTTTLEINVLPQHVSTQESYYQAEYLRTIKYIILCSTIHITIALGIPYALYWVGIKSGIVTNLDRCKLSAAVSVVVAAVTITHTAVLSLNLSKLITIPDFIPTQCNACGIPNAIVICIVL